jgi:hypothetical protein
MTTSVALEKQFEEKLENDQLVLSDIWEKPSSYQIDIPSVSAIDDMAGKMKTATEMICITSNVKLPKVLLHEIARLGKNGIRFYILLNEYYSEYEPFFTQNALVRVDRHINGVLLLIDAKPGFTNKNGFLYTYNSFDVQKSALNSCVAFTGSQLKEAFHYFLWRFWESMEEYRDGKMLAPNQLRPPFDILPLLEPEEYYFNSDDSGYLKDRVIEMIDSATYSIHLSLSDFKEYDVIFDSLNQKAKFGVQIYVYTDFKKDHLFLKRLEAIENIHIYANDHINSYFLLVDSQKGLFLTGSIESLSYETGILLNHKDVQDFMSNLAFQQNDFWRYHQKLSLGHIKGEEIVWEKFNKKADKAVIEKHLVIDQGMFEAKSLREYFEAGFKPERKRESVLARQIVYRWKLTPKLRDRNSKLDPLYDQWDREIKKIGNHVNKVLEYAISTKNEKKDFLSTFIGKFLSNKDDKLNNIIQDLEFILKSLEENNYNVEVLNTFVSKVINHSQQLLSEKMELTEKKQFHEEKRMWEEEKGQLEAVQLEILKVLDQLKKKKADLQTDNDGQGEEQEKVKQIDDQILEIDLEIESLQDTNKDFFEKYSIEKAVLGICKDLDDKIKSFDKLNKKKKKNFYQKEVEPAVMKKMEALNLGTIYESIMSICNISDSKARMSYLKKELATHPELRAGEQASPELIEKMEQLEKDKSSLQTQFKELESKKSSKNEALVKQEKALEQDIEKKENELRLTERKIEKMGDDFVFSSKVQDTQLPFSINPSFSLPIEELPKVGVLYKSNKVRQLAISVESELIIGENEAERLKAELVLES